MADPTETWLLALNDELASAIAGLVAEGTSSADTVAVQSFASGRGLIERLARLRLRVVIMAEPPADPFYVDALLIDRRHRPGLRIIHLTPAKSVDRRVQALDMGVDDALALPVTPREIVPRARLQAARARRRSDGSGLIPLSADIALDVVAHELRRDGETVHLRPKEFGLLSLLVTHPGRVYSRRQLLDRVWGTDHHGDPRTVDVHVRWLRSKIEPDPDHPTRLVTVRGIGYRIDLGHR